MYLIKTLYVIENLFYYYKQKNNMNIKHGLNKLREAFFYIEARLNNMGLTISYGWLYVVNYIYYVSERKNHNIDIQSILSLMFALIICDLYFFL